MAPRCHPPRPARATGAPRVSVLIPAHDAAGRLPRALRSALGQSIEDLEVIVVDDASSDGTFETACRFAAADQRVRVLRNPVNCGPAGARNLALDAARGTWIALLDSDDAYLPARLARLLRFAEREGADMIADNLLLHDAAGRRPGQRMLPPSLLPQPRPVDAAAFLRGNLPVPGHPRVSYGFLKPVFRRSFLEAHGLRYQRMRFAEDFDLYLRCLLAGARFCLIPEPGYAYTVRGDSLTARHGAGDLVRLRSLDRQLGRDLHGVAGPQLAAALDEHQRSIERRLVWRMFAQSVARGRWRRALRIATRNRTATSLVARELLREGPRHVLRRLRHLPRPVLQATA